MRKSFICFACEGRQTHVQGSQHQQGHPPQPLEKSWNRGHGVYHGADVDNFDNVADDNLRHKKDLDSVGGGNALSDVALLRGLGAAGD